MLASIQQILDFKKHPDADRLNVIKVLGWNCVTAESYNIGDKVVYIEIDTTVPRTEWSEFLFPENKPDRERERIKSKKLRGIISQGLCLPLHLFPNIPTEIGTDVSKFLDVEKYEKPVPQASNAKGNFPVELVSKTDEVRIQNYPALIDLLQGVNVAITLKYDGTSGTFIKDDSGVRICSRNLELKPEESGVYGHVAEKYELTFAMELGDILQGEVVGPGVQKNTSKEPVTDLYLFNLVRNGKQMGHEALKKYCLERNLKMVTVIYEGPFNFKTIEEILDYADAQTYPRGGRAEGIVIRPLDEQFSEILQGRLSFKVISNKYALKHGE